MHTHFTIHDWRQSFRLLIDEKQKDLIFELINAAILHTERRVHPLKSIMINGSGEQKKEVMFSWCWGGVSAHV